MYDGGVDGGVDGGGDDDYDDSDAVECCLFTTASRKG
jgi:hypothetical protein